MLLECLDHGILKKCNKPYKNPWFLIAKKLAKTYRLINAAIKINLVILWDANMPLFIDKFSKEFARC